MSQATFGVFEVGETKMGMLAKRVIRRAMREWKSNLFWMVVQVCTVYIVGATALHLLESHGVQHPYTPALLMAFLAYCIVLISQAWYETIKQSQHHE